MLLHSQQPTDKASEPMSACVVESIMHLHQTGVGLAAENRMLKFRGSKRPKLLEIVKLKQDWAKKLQTKTDQAMLD